MEPIYDSDMDITPEKMIEWMGWAIEEDPTGPDGSYYVEYSDGKRWVSDTKVTVKNRDIDVSEAMTACAEVAYKSGYFDGLWIEEFVFNPEKLLFEVTLGS